MHLMVDKAASLLIIMLLKNRFGVFCLIKAMPRYWDVRTTQGIVRGYYKQSPPHFAFLGVPYARPPTGHDRFKSPEAPRAWDGIFEATYRVRCPQADRVGSEDCLVVNVFVPAGKPNNASVLMHFHDGQFQSGWGAYHPPSHFIDQDIIIVTFNHRISAPGFLCLRSPGVPGNAGLKDQVAALYWVQQNIGRFHGNPNDVSVFGTGTGAVAIELLLLSGATHGLFHKAILESGSVLSPSSLSQNPLADAVDAAKELGYTDHDNLKTLQIFFEKISIQRLVNVSMKWLPCLENESQLFLIHKDPLYHLKSGYFQRIPLLVAYSNSRQIELIVNNKERFRSIPENFGPLLPNNLDIEDLGVKRKIANLTKKFYFHSTESADDILQGYMDYVNDIFLEYPVVTSAAYYAYKSNFPVFLMKFSYKIRENNLVWDAKHGDIFQLVFKDIDFLESPKSVVAYNLRMLWTNFIKLGDPTPITTSLVPEVWMPVTTHMSDGKINYGKISFMNFGNTLRNQQITTQQFKFWAHIYDKFFKYYLNNK